MKFSFRKIGLSAFLAISAGLLFSGQAIAKSKIPGPAPKVVKTISVAGTWNGSYVQPITIIEQGKDNRLEKRRISFTLHLRETASGLEGETNEANQYGEDREVLPTLRATVVGKTSGNHVTFVKTYDGGRGVIQYEGVLDPAGKSLVGTWTRDSESGAFEANLVSARASTK